MSLVQGGLDPKLSIPTDLAAAPGGALQIPVKIDSIIDLTGSDVESAELVIYYDAAALEVTEARLRSLLASSGAHWSIAFRIDPLAGGIIVSLAGNRPLEGVFQGELVQIQAKVKETAAPGAIAINLANSSRDPSRFTQLNEGYLTLIPAPTDAGNDRGVDGIISILPSPTRSKDAGRATAKLMNDQLLITGTSGDDRIWIAPYGADRLRVRVKHEVLGTFEMPSSLAIDALTGQDYVVSAFLNGAALIAAADSAATNTQDMIFASGKPRVVESPSVGDPVRISAGPTTSLSPHEVALLHQPHLLNRATLTSSA